MAKKTVFIIAIVAVSLLLNSCYPELSVQQYDKLRNDIATLDIERKQLEETLEAERAQLEATIMAEKAKNEESLAYVNFLAKLVSTQNTQKILTGEFDTASLISAKTDLTELADSLGDNEITYFLGLLKPDNDGLTVQSYYKVIEYCLKKLKQNLE